jgi:hypothetical protein
MIYPVWLWIAAMVLFMLNVVELVVGLLDRTAKPG